MAVRPSQSWREGVEQDKREIAEGVLEPEEGCMAALFPESLLTRTDEVLAAFEAETAALDDPSDEQVFTAVPGTDRGVTGVRTGRAVLPGG